MAMTDEQIRNITTQACMWSHDQVVKGSKGSEESAVSYRVVGMADDLKAKLHVVRRGNSGLEEWRFQISRCGQEDVLSNQPYGSKKEALDGIREWLRNHARQ